MVHKQLLYQLSILDIVLAIYIGYYYHNCEFVEAESPPTIKNVRDSFIKLHALFENKV